jgi:hypothetical protein
LFSRKSGGDAESVFVFRPVVPGDGDMSVQHRWNDDGRGEIWSVMFRSYFAINLAISSREKFRNAPSEVCCGVTWRTKNPYGLSLGAKLRKAAISFVKCACLSFCKERRKNLTPTGWSFMKFYICIFSESVPRKFKFN